jgi:ATP-dependent helicase/nuclease subunit B
MIDLGTGPHVFALPPGVDFARELVRGLHARMPGQPPEAIARVTIYLNTERMRRRVVEAFGDAGAGFLPRITLVTDLARDPSLDLPAPGDALSRRLTLMRLIAPLLQGGAAAGMPVAPESALYDTADTLAALADEMQGEDVGIDRLEALDFGTLSAHWQRSLGFLRLAAPVILDPSAPEALRRRAVEEMARKWSEIPPAGPVIVAGSTGSRGTTKALMQAVAGMPQGAVVLPGVDPHMPADVWDHLLAGLAAEDHPQTRFALLGAALGFHPADIRSWTDGPLHRAADRAPLISLALRPAPVTDQWLRDGPDLGDLVVRSEGLTLIEAPDPRAEALSIAVLMRASVEEGKRVALITPDRVLTRRVAASLEGWGLKADDSGGLPLNQTAPGRLLRHVVQAMEAPLPVDRLFILLSHPLTASEGNARGPHLLLTRELGLHLRRHGPLIPLPQTIRDWAADKGRDRIWADWVAGLLDLLTPVEGPQPLAHHAARHLTLVEALARGPGNATGTGELWLEDPGIAARALMAKLEAAAAAGDPCTTHGYGRLFDALISGETVRDPVQAHPLLSILGTLEARVECPDRVILAGLNEGSWPRQPAPDPWMNRQMRQRAGLLLPDRQIGLSAHDFQQAMAMGEVVLTRAKRDADAQTVPSRWVNRLTNLLDGLPDQRGPAALTAMRDRGAYWLGLAARLDRPAETVPAAPRPSPAPPLFARPRELSVTGIETLIRNPFEIYARHILRLYPLRPLRPQPDMRDRGTIYHAVLSDYARTRAMGEQRDAAIARLLRLGEAHLAAEVASPSQRLQWMALLERAAPHLVDQDAEMGGWPVLSETPGSMRLDPHDFTLTARPDRIDVMEDGETYRVVDFKTGSLPSNPQIKAFRKQLILTAMIVEQGGFADLGPAPVAEVRYLRINDSGKLSHQVEAEKLNLSEERAKLLQLIGHYLVRTKGYTARRAPELMSDASDYDHLSRLGEWDETMAPEPVIVGDRDAQ